jgi:uncharacterized protein DUF6519
MSGDYSRLPFDPAADVDTTLLQQGRPLTDWDWNDAAMQIARRAHAHALDTFKQNVVPRTTPTGFEIGFDANGAPTIGVGRMYVDGLLAENHGTGVEEWDPRLAEVHGDVLPYDLQPYLPTRRDEPQKPDLPEGGRHVVYLDVWSREITPLERPELVDPALNVDTTTRLQTVWQVRFLSTSVGADFGCDSPNVEWDSLIAPSAGRLSTDTVAAGKADSCLIPPSGGYKGLENQLYRVEIHRGGGQGQATFKWSRDNASVAARVIEVVDAKNIIVDSIGKDRVLRFNPGDWIEILDDSLELGVDAVTNRPAHVGHLHRIAVGGVDDATRILTLESPLNATAFPVGPVDASRHTRVRRWDQRGKMFEADGEIKYFDVDTGPGDIPVPKPGLQVLLENGILVSFDVDAPDGAFRSGDWWVFAARAGDASNIEKLVLAPPRGVHHHFARLGIADFGVHAIADCRTLWPPETGNDSCCCTVCVSPEDQRRDASALQTAINKVMASGGTVCLLPGHYLLREPLRIAGAQEGLAVVGHGAATVLEAATGAFDVLESQDVRLRDFVILCPASVEQGTGHAAVSIRGVWGAVVERLAIGFASRRVVETEVVAAANVALDDVAIELVDAGGETLLRENRIVAPTGIRVRSGRLRGSEGETLARSPESLAGQADLVIDDNLLDCAQVGVVFDEVTIAQLLTRLRGNRLVGCNTVGISLGGVTVPGASIEVAANHLSVAGHGIVCGVGGYRIADNDLVQISRELASREGIVVRLGRGPNTTADIQVTGNRVSGFLAVGIDVGVSGRTLAIARNLVERTSCGIRVHGGEWQQALVEDNRIAELYPPAMEPTAAGDDSSMLGVFIEGAMTSRACANMVAVDSSAPGVATFGGIEIAGGSHATVSGNEVVGPAISKGAFGIKLTDLDDSIRVTQNVVRRLLPAEGDAVTLAMWIPLIASGAWPKGRLSEQIAKLSRVGVQAELSMIQNLSFLKPLRRSAGRLSGEVAARAVNPVRPVPSVFVKDNQLEGDGLLPVAVVSGQFDCEFSGNHCVRRGVDVENRQADVGLGSITLVAANNRILGGSLAIEATVKSGFFTCLGNLTRGSIRINGDDLLATSTPLNTPGG